jgi:hypothetical protein
LRYAIFIQVAKIVDKTQIDAQWNSQSSVFKTAKMSSVTSAFGGKHTCQLCGYEKLQKANLKLHEQNVHDGRKFQCPL